MNSLELFTGGGGLALGVERGGFAHLALIERDRDSCVTLRHNRPDWAVIEQDVRDIEYRAYCGRVDLLAAGAPCQPFSLGGKHAGQNDKRNLFPEVVRAVRELQPRAFLIENVRGLTRKSFLPYFHYIIAQLRQPTVRPRPGEDWFEHHERLGKSTTGELTYRVGYGVVNAADYGVPQERQRVFIVGFRADEAADWAWPEPTHSREALIASQKITLTYWRAHGLKPPSRELVRVARPRLGEPMERWETLRDALAALPDPCGEEAQVVPNHIYVPGARPYKGHTGSNLDWPAKTLKAGDHGVPGGENTLTDSTGTFRYLTVREAARVQTFPDNWTFVSSRTEAMRQIGNAVPVELAEVFSASIRHALEAHSPVPSSRPDLRVLPARR